MAHRQKPVAVTEGLDVIGTRHMDLLRSMPPASRRAALQVAPRETGQNYAEYAIEFNRKLIGSLVAENGIGMSTHFAEGFSFSCRTYKGREADLRMQERISQQFSFRENDAYAKNVVPGAPLFTVELIPESGVAAARGTIWKTALKGTRILRDVFATNVAFARGGHTHPYDAVFLVMCGEGLWYEKHEGQWYVQTVQDGQIVFVDAGVPHLLLSTKPSLMAEMPSDPTITGKFEATVDPQSRAAVDSACREVFEAMQEEGAYCKLRT